MQTLPTSSIVQRTVGDVVAEDYRLGSIFKRFGIDFCCGGARTIAEACEKKGVPLDAVENALVEARRLSNKPGDGDPRRWPLDFLVDYITNVHHRYVREHLPILTQFATKVARVHGDASPELLEVADLVYELAEEMMQHLQDEETTLFPYVKQLVVAQTQEIRPAHSKVVWAEEAVAQLEHDHDGAGAFMRRLRNITSDYTPPRYACNTYRALFATLEQFEEDLHRHVHLENNVLFPQALRLEKELLGA